MHQECLFCNFAGFSLICENHHSYAIWDKYPVTEMHALIISKNHYDSAFALPAFELVSIFELAKQCRDIIMKKDRSVAGFNFGANAGEVAGQKIFHVHFHLIPRREGDVAPPMAQQGND